MIQRVLIGLRYGLGRDNPQVVKCVQILHSAGVEVDFSHHFGDHYDFGIALGGDGTFLTVAESLHGTDTPIIGINFGNIGFLSDGNADRLEEIIKSLLDGQLDIQSRATIDVEIVLPDGENFRDWAINDVALEKAGTLEERHGMLNVQLKVNDTPFTGYGCDGVIVSTATGSTAHAYSAGGPIICPDVDCFQVLPVAAHALFSRPLILGAGAKLQLQIDKAASGYATLICDGHRIHKIPQGTVVTVKQGKERVHFATTSGRGFTSKLVEKFHLPHSWKVSDA